MPNNCLSVLYKRIIQVENKNVGLKVCGGGGGHKHTIAPPIKKVGGTCPPLPTPVIYIYKEYDLFNNFTKSFYFLNHTFNKYEILLYYILWVCDKPFKDRAGFYVVSLPPIIIYI